MAQMHPIRPAHPPSILPHLFSHVRDTTHLSHLPLYDIFGRKKTCGRCESVVWGRGRKIVHNAIIGSDQSRIPLPNGPPMMALFVLSPRSPRMFMAQMHHIPPAHPSASFLARSRDASFAHDLPLYSMTFSIYTKNMSCGRCERDNVVWGRGGKIVWDIMSEGGKNTQRHHREPVGEGHQRTHRRIPRPNGLPMRAPRPKPDPPPQRAPDSPRDHPTGSPPNGLTSRHSSGPEARSSQWQHLPCRPQKPFKPAMFLPPVPAPQEIPIF